MNMIRSLAGALVAMSATAAAVAAIAQAPTPPPAPMLNNPPPAPTTPQTTTPTPTPDPNSAYSASTWSDAVKIVPCDAFERNFDGSWTQTGVIYIDGNPNSGNTFRNVGYTTVLDQRCINP